MKHFQVFSDVIKPSLTDCSFNTDVSCQSSCKPLYRQRPGPQKSSGSESLQRVITQIWEGPSDERKEEKQSSDTHICLFFTQVNYKLLKKRLVIVSLSRITSTWALWPRADRTEFTVIMVLLCFCLRAKLLDVCFISWIIALTWSLRWRLVWIATMVHCENVLLELLEL